jgi:EmrB/QacA subfamily drug resistance transporter
MKDLSAPLAYIEWVVMIYLLTVSSFLLNFGRLSDIVGRRRIYVWGLIVFSIGSLCCSISGNTMLLIASRSFQGIGAAMIMACTPALVVDIFPEAERGKALGMVGAVVASGLTIGPALGGLLLHFFSWRAIFYINIPIGILTAAAAAILLKGGRADITRKESFDWAGALLLAFCFGSFLVAVTHGYNWGYTSMPVILLLCISMMSITGLVVLESRVTHPIIETSLIKIRLFTLPVLAALALFASLFTLVFLMPFYLIYPCGFSVDKAGYIMVTLFVALFFVSPVSGAISDRIGSRLLCTIGMSILAYSLFSIAELSPTLNSFPIIWRLALAGIGTAIFLPPNSSAAMSAVPSNHRGIAAGTVATARNLGMVLGVAIAGAVFNIAFHTLSGGLSLKLYQPKLETIFMDAFHYAMVTGGILAVVGIILSFMRGSENSRFCTEWSYK